MTLLTSVLSKGKDGFPRMSYTQSHTCALLIFLSSSDICAPWKKESIRKLDGNLLRSKMLVTHRIVSIHRISGEQFIVKRMFALCVTCVCPVYI